VCSAGYRWLRVRIRVWWFSVVYMARHSKADMCILGCKRWLGVFNVARCVQIGVSRVAFQWFSICGGCTGNQWVLSKGVG